MKTLFLVSAGIAALVVVQPAAAGLASIGNSLARDCYEAAIGRDRDRNAMNHCDLALRNEGLSAEERAATLVNRGVLHLRNRDYRSANRDFDAALRHDETNGEAWLNKAVERLRQNGSDDALPFIEKALEHDTREKALAYYSRAVVYERIGNVRAAYADYKRAAELAPRWKAPAEDLARYQVIRR